ncbi:hypothetical protein [Kitasatospora purpeofusca]|uniref:hypothetical protein n=1 Tax=Kitasatospora purpeofusca TaxID=67352 RepID=UPI003668431C
MNVRAGNNPRVPGRRSLRRVVVPAAVAVAASLMTVSAPLLPAAVAAPAKDGASRASTPW